MAALPNSPVHERESAPDRVRYATLPDELRHPNLVRLYRHWDEVRRGRPMPSRADVDPLSLPQLLGHLLHLGADEVDLAQLLGQCAVRAGSGERERREPAVPTLEEEEGEGGAADVERGDATEDDVVVASLGDRLDVAVDPADRTLEDRSP